MKAQIVLNRYKACIHNANWIFNHYEKYRSCYSIRSVDEEMKGILHKVGLSSARLMHIVEARKRNDFAEPAITDVIDECDALLRDRNLLFFKTMRFLNANMDMLLTVFEDETCQKSILKDIDAQESNLAYATKLINRMEMMLKSSQHIYSAGLALQQIA